MGTRNVEATIVAPGGLGKGVLQAIFTLQCADNVQVVEGHTFEIVAPNNESVRATPLPKQVIFQSNGTIVARMLCERGHHSFEVMVERLRRLPNVSNLRVIQS